MLPEEVLQAPLASAFASPSDYFKQLFNGSAVALSSWLPPSPPKLLLLGAFYDFDERPAGGATTLSRFELLIAQLLPFSSYSVIIFDFYSNPSLIKFVLSIYQQSLLSQ